MKKKTKAISKIIANEAWRMLPDSCKIIMKALKKTYKASLAADIKYHIKTNKRTTKNVK